MGKLKKRSKIRLSASKVKKIINAGEYEEFEDDDIYVKPCKKTKLIIWAKGLDEDLKSRSNTMDIFEKVQKQIAKLVLSSMCYSNGELIGDSSCTDDISDFTEFDYALIKKLIIETFQINRLPKKQGEELLSVFKSLEELENEIEFNDDLEKDGE